MGEGAIAQYIQVGLHLEGEHARNIRGARENIMVTYTHEGCIALGKKNRGRERRR